MSYVSKLAAASAVAQEAGRTLKLICRTAPIVAAASLLSMNAAPQANAAPPTPAPFGAPVATAAPADPYNFTADQKAKITALEQSYQTQIQAVDANPKLSQDQKATKISQLVDQGFVQKRALLDKTQQALFDSQRAKQKAADPLHLSTLQQVKLQILNDQSNKQAQALLASPSLSIDQKAKAIAAEVMQSHNARRAALNPDQQKTFDGLQAKLDASDPLHQTLYQRVKLRLIQNQGMMQMQAIGQNSKMTMPQKQAAAKVVNDTVIAQMNSVLTPAQLKIAKARQAQMAQQAH